MSDRRRLTLICLVGVALSVPISYLVVSNMETTLDVEATKHSGFWVVDEFKPGAISENVNLKTGQIEGQLIDYIVCRKEDLAFELEVYNMYLPFGFEIGSRFKLTFKAENRIRRKISESGDDDVIVHLEREDITLIK